LKTDSHPQFEIPLGKRTLTANFDGGSISSDAGLVLLGQADKAIGLTTRLAGRVNDERDQSKVKQSVQDMLIQRIFGIACGYEDCNDHDALRSDPMLKVSAEREPVSGEDLASQPTLSRLENSVGARELWRMEETLLDLFIMRHREEPPVRIVIDADATDDPAHGQQEFEFFHGFYGCHCYLPLLVYVSADNGEQELAAAVLRPGNVHASHRLVSVLKRLVPRLAVAFPEAELVFRGDAGMALPAVYDYLEEEGLFYLISLPKNDVLLSLAKPFIGEARLAYEETGEKVRQFGEFLYRAKTWEHDRRVIVKAEVLPKGENPRFVLTNIDGDPEYLYEEYTDRGDVENRIKELKDDLFSGRTSCHSFLANQFRLILHASAFLLLAAIRRMLSGTEMAKAQAGTIRAKLLKVGARVHETTRRIWVKMPDSYPYKNLWAVVFWRLTPVKT
jgi:hypothetical protein